MLTYGQIALMLTVLKDRPALGALVGLVPFGLMVHMYTWLIPLWRERQHARRG